jgi:hypothetical protein
MKKTSTYLVAMLAAGALTLAGCSSSPASPTTSAPAQPAVSGASSSSATVLPVTSDPISNNATAPGLKVSNVLLQNNTDASGATISDRLQFTVSNSTANPLTGVKVFYTMTDAKTKASESYYQPLTGLVVPAKGSVVVYFDNSGKPGHFPENKFSIYRSSLNKVGFTIEVSAPGLKIATGTGTKDAGAGETGD